MASGSDMKSRSRILAVVQVNNTQTLVFQRFFKYYFTRTHNINIRESREREYKAERHYSCPRLVPSTIQTIGLKTTGISRKNRRIFQTGFPFSAISITDFQ